MYKLPQREFFVVITSGMDTEVVGFCTPDVQKPNLYSRIHASMSRQPHLYAAVFAVFVNDEGKVLLLKRKNTGYYDGGYSLPAGHVEDGELCSQSLQHEMKEELGIEIDVQGIKPFHTIHKLDDLRQYFDVGYIITERQGEIINGELDKCETLEWFSPDQIPAYTTEEAKIFIEVYRSGSSFSEIDLRTKI